MDKIQMELFEQLTGLHEIPAGAYNIRANSKKDSRNTTANIDIVTKEDKDGIDIYVKPGTKNESVHIPVVISKTGLEECVYNDFHIGEGADVLIVAGCGIHNSGDKLSRHDGIHTFYIEEGGYMEMETVQIKGIDSTNRVTKGKLDKDAKIVITERIMTHGNQTATTRFEVDMDGDGSSANVISRSVARDNSKQIFYSVINGNARCNGHSECDAIIMDNAKISAIPEITANDLDASLIHEAAIGKIAGEQLIKLQTLGLTEAEAEEQIVNGFLK